MAKGDTFGLATNRSSDANEIDTALARGESERERLSSLLVSVEARQTPRTGAVALMTAVLEEAIRSCFSPGPQVRAEAEAWLMSGQRKSVFSFLTICESLGLDPAATRRAIRRLVADVGRRRPMRRSRTNVRRTTPLSEPLRGKTKPRR